jgi:hypothetical protein
MSLFSRLFSPPAWYYSPTVFAAAFLQIIFCNEVALPDNQGLFTVVAISMTALMAGDVAQVDISDSLAKS